MKKALILILLFWFIIGAGFVISQESVWWGGKTVYLEVLPIDPKDLLRGNYVDLEFKDFTRLKLLNNDKQPKKGQMVNKTVFPDERNVAKAGGIYFGNPPKGVTYLKGEVVGKRKYPEWTVYYLKYGIENYFTSPKEAKLIEQEFMKGGYAKVVINKDGRAKVIKLVKEIK